MTDLIGRTQTFFTLKTAHKTSSFRLGGEVPLSHMSQWRRIIQRRCNVDRLRHMAYTDLLHLAAAKGNAIGPAFCSPQVWYKTRLLINRAVLGEREHSCLNAWYVLLSISLTTLCK